ncbi:sporulation initiation factor Spo0A C-terminal domain-containing protein [Eubacterium pyruvativorans]|uniref:sporulation initiation factor Spo0A C-terminal domain-containing protein n=1 Tax=Eubacterium pyruvativorans TaxID=155865 RepID=UPI001563B324|nr:sporulation initiation factor Spo0A C-terminal domain-containing protein [Eubacterium pyruvativorans]
MNGYWRKSREMTEEEETMLQLRTERLLLRLGIPMNLNGFKYLCRCCVHTALDPTILQRITKTVYPIVADEFNVTVGSVEIAIRRAIDAAWNEQAGIFRQRYSDLSLGHCWKKPKNTEFISVVAWRLRYELPGRTEYGDILPGMMAADTSRSYRQEL